MRSTSSADTRGITASKLIAPVIAAVFASVTIAAPAAAKPKAISGKLSKPGYTVIALASNGKARAAAAKGKTSN